MNWYAVFGGCLSSEVDFPELSPCSDSVPKWMLRKTCVRHSEPSEYLGKDQVDPNVQVRLYRTDRGYLLRFDDTGDFLISEDGFNIEWCPAAGARLEAARIDILGRVLPLALHLRGTFCLHGSAVVFQSGGIAFLAPKFGGKSTLALALTNAGARLGTDDTVAVEPGPPVRLQPGVHALRLWVDSASRLSDLPLRDTPPGDKQQVEPSAERLQLHPVSLQAVYLLSPIPQGGVAARRERLSQVPSALALVRHAKLGPLFGGPQSVVWLRWAAALARTVPVYQLEVVRDFERLPEVVASFVEWHGEPAEAALPLEVGG